MMLAYSALYSLTQFSLGLRTEVQLNAFKVELWHVMLKPSASRA
jgi:hypothetical protein